MIEEIRSACGVAAAPSGAAEEEESDEAAADVKAGTAPVEEAMDELELEAI